MTGTRARAAVPLILTYWLVLLLLCQVPLKDHSRIKLTHFSQMVNSTIAARACLRRFGKDLEIRSNPPPGPPELKQNAAVL